MLAERKAKNIKGQNRNNKLEGLDLLMNTGRVREGQTREVNRKN
jgi:hypothetical protein